MKLPATKLLLLVALLFAPVASAQDLDLSGNARWFKSGSRLRIEAAQIHNGRESGTSGSLRLQIWATEAPYDGTNDLVGFVIGSASLRPLVAGGDYFNVVKRTTYRRPPPGYYYTTITLEERYSDGTWLIIDSENFPGVVNLGGYGEGEVTLTLHPTSDISFEGIFSWFAGDGRVELYAERIHNLAPFRSGSLRLRLMASDEKYEPPYTPENPFYAYPMTTKRLRRILPYSQIEYYTRTRFRPPPEGEWFVTVLLEEYNRGWYVRDYYTFNDPRLF
jgi:hypothetical protein